MFALSSLILIGVVLILFSYLLKDKKKIWYFLTGSFAVYLLSAVIKSFFQRVRPLGSEIASFSFPSGHAAIYFFMYAFMSDNFGEYKNYFLALAVLVSLSRLYFSLHYFSDIIGGALLGIGAYYILKKWLMN